MNTTTKCTCLPRSRYEGTPLYLAVEKALAELIANDDLHIKTPYEKVVSHLCERVEAGVPRFYDPRIM